jgi:hypothetical protein
MSESEPESRATTFGMSHEARDKVRIGTVAAADKAYDTQGFVAQLRQISARSPRGSNVPISDGRSW